MAATWDGLLVPLRGSVVALEPLAREHRSELAAIADDPAIWRWMPLDGSAPEQFARWFEDSLAAAAAGREAPFATRSLADGRLLGSTRYLALRPEHRGLEIGYTWLAASAWGGGPNVEAKLLQLRHAFESAGAQRVEFKTDARNARSRAALEALGARYEGIFRKHMLVRGGVVRDSAWYAICDDEWPALRTRLERRLAGRSPGWGGS